MNEPARSRRVMVADDDPDTRDVLKRFLERRGFEVETVEEGEEAASRIRQGSFDVFFLDCDMPGLTGLELVGLARRYDPAARIFIISGFPSVDDLTLKSMGGDRFIHKPIQLETIEKILQEEDMA